jgi:hypothetical protein
MTEATQATFASQTIAVEHIKISSERSFAEVRRRLEGTLPMLDASIAELLRSGDQKHATEYEVSGPKLSIFEERRSWLALAGFWPPAGRGLPSGFRSLRRRRAQPGSPKAIPSCVEARLPDTRRGNGPGRVTGRVGRRLIERRTCHAVARLACGALS